MWSGVVTALLLLLLGPAAVDAANALSLQAGSNWLGIDGRWSTFDFEIGTNDPVAVSLTVCTALSEIWVVEESGCSQNALCTAARGGVYDPSKSSSWQSLGAWQLGLTDNGYGGNGDYGMETLAMGSPSPVTVNSALMASINDTQYYVGYVGVGPSLGNFSTRLVNPLISQLVETMGVIPSHSYGYTAGASYIGSQAGVSGTRASLTFGGYDANRFVPHAVTFNLNPQVHIPQVLLRGIVASVPSADKAPTAWNSTTRVLSGMNDSHVAIIDTSTPYLWLPEAVCDRFAEALGLVWNATLSLYLFGSDQQYQSFLNGSSLSFTFVTSSFDNTNNFGQPFDTAGVVNVTISSAAFALTVQYPFSPTMHFRDPAIPYFPLMRARADQVIIGRAFMQEAYLVTRYEDNVFSIHQALFPQNAAEHASIVDIPPNPNFHSYQGGGATGGIPLSTGAIAGIVVSASVASTIVAVAIWYCRRRQRSRKQQRRAMMERGDDDLKDNGSSVGSEPPPSPIKRIFSFIIRRRRSKKPAAAAAAHEVSGNSAPQPVEVANHELFELPVPLEPVELDSTNEGGSLGDDTTVLGTDGSDGLSHYELARRKLQRQLQGPVPTYSPAADGEKTDQDVSPVAHYRPPPPATEDDDNCDGDASPVSPPSYGHNTNSLPDMLPSPMTPRGDWPARFDLIARGPPPPLPMPIVTRTVSNDDVRSDSDRSSIPPVSPQSPGTADHPMSRSASSGGSLSSSSLPPRSPLSLVPPTAVYQRAPIDPSRVICLGPLPENLRPPQPQPQQQQLPLLAVPRIVRPDDQAVVAAAHEDAAHPTSASISREEEGRRRRASTDTLGSNFTVDEELRVARHPVPRHASLRHDGDVPLTPASAERIDAGSELVHVPQLAERRYSWEEGSSL